MTEPPPLLGRRALVTGASRGIGLACAQALVRLGARVAMVARSGAVLREHAEAIGPNAHAVEADLADADAAARVVDASTSGLGGTPDILVNSAGVFSLARIAEADIADVRRALDVNLLAPFILLRAVIGTMAERGEGHIVTIGSVADRVIYPENGAYAASKFGARALHEVARAELRGTGIRTTLVSPGPVDTAMWDAVDPDSRDGFTPRSAMLSADAVADAVCWALTRPAAVNVDELRLSRS